MKRVFLIVLDSVGMGEMPDAAEYGDAGSNTILAVSKSPYFSMPNMKKLGYFNIDGMAVNDKEEHPTAAFARMTESSKGKDTTIGHWEIAGIISKAPLPTYPNGFPKEILEEFSKQTGRGVLCNKPYSGTEVIKDYGDEHRRTGDLIVSELRRDIILKTTKNAVRRMLTRPSIIGVSCINRRWSPSRMISIWQTSLLRGKKCASMPFLPSCMG